MSDTTCTHTTHARTPHKCIHSHRRTHTHTHTETYTHTHTRMHATRTQHAHTHVCMHACTHAHTHQCSLVRRPSTEVEGESGPLCCDKHVGLLVPSGEGKTCAPHKSDIQVYSCHQHHVMSHHMSHHSHLHHTLSLSHHTLSLLAPCHVTVSHTPHRCLHSNKPVMGLSKQNGRTCCRDDQYRTRLPLTSTTIPPTNPAANRDCLSSTAMQVIWASTHTHGHEGWLG